MPRTRPHGRRRRGGAIQRPARHNLEQCKHGWRQGRLPREGHADNRSLLRPLRNSHRANLASGDHGEPSCSPVCFGIYPRGRGLKAEHRSFPRSPRRIRISHRSGRQVCGTGRGRCAETTLMYNARFVLFGAAITASIRSYPVLQGTNPSDGAFRALHAYLERLKIKCPTKLMPPLEDVQDAGRNSAFMQAFLPLWRAHRDKI